MTISAAVVIAERYEALRTAVLAHRTSGERRGLALLMRDGMAAWIEAWPSCAAPSVRETSTGSATFAERPAIAGTSAVVSLLASMALSTLSVGASS